MNFAVNETRYTNLRASGEQPGLVYYRAHDAERDTAVRLHLFTALDTEQRALLEAECRLRSTLKHPNLNPILDVGRTGSGAVYCSSAETPGYGLNDIPPARFGDLAFVIPVLEQILGVYACLHAHGLLLGFPGSAVLRCTGGPEPKVHLNHSAFLLSALRATPFVPGGIDDNWMAPEDLSGGAIDARADMYLLGVALYRALSGRYPYNGEFPRRMSMQLYGEAAPLQEYAPHIPDVLADWVQRLLERERSKRFYSAREALEYFARYSLLPAEKLHLLPERAAIGYSAQQPVGCEAAHGAIRQFLEDERPWLVLELAGESGTGKTALLRAVHRELELLAVPVLMLESPDCRALRQALDRWESPADTSVAGDDLAARFLAALGRIAAEKRDFVLLVDDADKPEAAFRELLHELQSAVPELPGRLKIVAAHTSQLRVFGKEAHIKTLAKLAPTQVEWLCRAILGRCEFSEEFYRSVYRYTRGNPLALQLLLRELMRRRIINRHDDYWISMAREVPAGLSAVDVLAGELGRMDSARLCVLGILARRRAELSLAEVLEESALPRHTALQALYLLAQEGYVHFGHTGFMIAHKVYADTVAEVLAKGEAIADDSQAADRASVEQAGLFRQVTRSGKGAEVALGEPAEIRERLFELQQAEDWRALADFGAAVLAHGNGIELELRFETAQALAGAYRELQDEEREWRTFESMLADVRENGTEAMIVKAMLLQADAALAKGAYAVAENLAARIQSEYSAIAVHKNNRPLLEYILSRCCLHAGDAEGFIKMATGLPDSLLRQGAQQEAAVIACDLGTYYSHYQKEHAAALEYYVLAEDIFKSIGDTHHRARTLGRKGVVLLELQRFDEAQQCFGKSAELFEAVGDLRGKLTAYEHMIRRYLLTGKLEEARKLAGNARAIAGKLNDKQDSEKFDRLLERIAQRTRHQAGLESSPAVHAAAPPRTLPVILRGESDAIHKVRLHMQTAAANDSPVLLCGEFGTGVLETAAEIHAMGKRADRPYTVLNCSDYPAEELTRRVFGATDRGQGVQPSLLDECAGGSVLFEGIDHSSPRFQTLLTGYLRANAGKAHTDVRIMAACENPEAAMQQGRLKRDVYYALAVIRMQLPSLSGRRKDIPELAAALLAKLNEGLGKEISSIAPRLVQQLMRKEHWPGNVAELETVLHRLMLEENGPQLQGELARVELPPPAAVAASQPTNTAALASAPPEDISTIDQVQKEHILRVLQQTAGNKTRTAKLLGIKRTTLLARMKKFGLMP